MGNTTYKRKGYGYIQNRLLPINESLIRSVLASEPVPEKKPKKKLIYNGPKARAVTNKPPKIPDDVVLGVRTMREVHGMTPKQLMEVFNLTRNQIEAIIEYRYRVHLVPEQQP
jgi:hypothetical protein